MFLELAVIVMVVVAFVTFVSILYRVGEGE